MIITGLSGGELVFKLNFMRIDKSFSKEEISIDKNTLKPLNQRTGSIQPGEFRIFPFHQTASIGLERCHNEGSSIKILLTYNKEK